MATPAVQPTAEAVRSELVGAGRRVDEAAVRAFVARAYPLLPDDGASGLVADVIAEIRGLGPLEPLLADPAVTDVLVNGPGPVWVERSGRLERTDVVLATATDILRLVERIVAPLGLRIDPSSPYVDARLPDGSRLHVSIPPVAVDGPCLAIRRFGARAVALDQLCEPTTAQLLRAAVKRRRTLVISGGTGAGKTTLLNALAGEIDAGERVITIEDTAELRLPIDHVVRLEARPANADGVGEITVRDLVRNALRMRPDRIVVGEVRGPEAFDMLQAINTGHRGSLTTVHANSAPDALVRLESMVLLAGVGVSADAVRANLVRCVDLVVHVERGPDGRRQVTEVFCPRRAIQDAEGGATP